ncbi:MAG: acyl-CoA dehydrogenase family protein [Anaerolineales bacterium]|nr:acyl-CoA dehydrogenase family protein [Anaerolineales bacterium]
MAIDRHELDQILSTLNKYAEKKLTPEFLLKLDHEDRFPNEVLADLYNNIGLHLVFISEEDEGLGGSAYDVYRVSEAMAGIDVGIATGVLATFLGADPIIVGGTREQAHHWMSRIANEGLLVAYGATEPQAGSDLAQLKTKAVPVLDDNGTLKGYKITGRKQWISNGGVAEIYTILAQAPGGPSWFVVEKDAEGFSKNKPEDKHGIRLSNTAALFLEDVYVDADHLMGFVEGQGMAQAQAVFGYTRLMVAAFGLGAGWAALKRAIRYSQTRVQGGATLNEKQGYMDKLIVPNAVRLEASRAYIEWTAERIDAGDPNQQTEGAVAKYLATEAGNKAAEDAIQALGGYGYTKEYMVEKFKRDVRITTIYEGTSEIMEWTISRDRWQFHLKTKGAYYNDWAARMDAVAHTNNAGGASTAALALRALAVILERARIDRLTRNQHVLFRLGELIAFAETAAVFAERSVNQPSDALRFSPETLQTMSRIHARDAALKIATDGLRWTIGGGQTDPDLASSLNLPAIYAAQAGLLEDMDVAGKKLVETFPAE